MEITTFIIFSIAMILHYSINQTRFANKKFTLRNVLKLIKLGLEYIIIITIIALLMK